MRWRLFPVPPAFPPRPLARIVCHLSHYGYQAFRYGSLVACIAQASLPIIFGEAKSGYGNLIIELTRRVLSDVILGDFGGPFGIGCKQPLIQLLLRPKHRFAAQENPKKLKLGNVPSDYDQTDRQGG